MVDKLEEFVNTIRHLNQKDVPQTLIISGVFRSDIKDQDPNDPDFDNVPIHNFIVDSFQVGHRGDGQPALFFRGAFPHIDEENIVSLDPTNFINELLDLQSRWLDKSDEAEKYPPFFASIYIGLIAHTPDTQQAYAIGAVWDIDGEELGTIKGSEGTDLEIISVLSVFDPIPEDALNNLSFEQGTVI